MEIDAHCVAYRRGGIRMAVPISSGMATLLLSYPCLLPQTSKIILSVAGDLCYT